MMCFRIELVGDLFVNSDMHIMIGRIFTWQYLSGFIVSSREVNSIFNKSNGQVNAHVFRDFALDSNLGSDETNQTKKTKKPTLLRVLE